MKNAPVSLRIQEIDELRENPVVVIIEGHEGIMFLSENNQAIRS